MDLVHAPKVGYTYNMMYFQHVHAYCYSKRVDPDEMSYTWASHLSLHFYLINARLVPEISCIIALTVI